MAIIPFPPHLNQPIPIPPARAAATRGRGGDLIAYWNKFSFIHLRPATRDFGGQVNRLIVIFIIFRHTSI